MNFRYPVFLDLCGKRCLVTGEGLEVPGKVEALVQASAAVVYVHPTADPRIEALALSGLLEWHRRQFRASDLTGCFLVIADTDDNAKVFRFAEQRSVLCNCVDDPENCRFSFGSLHRQGDLTIAISTNGNAPAVAVRLKEKLQREVGPEYAALLAMLKTVRPSITTSIQSFEARKLLWYRIVDSPILLRLREQRWQDAASLLSRLIEDAASLAKSPVETTE